MLRKFIVGLALAGGLALGAFGAVGSAGAQSGPFCSKFDGGTQDGWGPCPGAPNITVTTSTTGGMGPSDPYLNLTDLSGASAACTTDSKYLGDWVARMGGCGQFCFDFKVFSSGFPPTAITPSFTIYSGAAKATFVANFQVAIGDTTWHQKICAPIALGANPPPSTQGHWVVSGGTWNSIITAVTMVSLPIDFSSSPSEVVGYDNLCMSPGGCGEIPKPEVTGCLKDMKVDVKCNPDGTYTVTLSGSSFTGTTITLTSQTPGVTVTPPQQPWAATTTWTLTGATPGQTVKLTATGTQASGGSAAGIDLCCSAEITIVMPECPKLPPIDVAIGKENSPAGGSGTWFNLWVTNVAAPISWPAGGLTITDNIPFGMTVTSLVGTSPNWTCTPTSLVGPGAITCTYNLAGSLGTGAQLSDVVIVNYVTTEPGLLRNCATVGVGATSGVDTNPSNDTACVDVTGTPGTVVVEKKVINNTDASQATIDALIFPIGLVCGLPSTLNVTFGLNNGGSHTENNIPYTSLCTVTESVSTLPPAPAGVCGQGSTAVWATPVITPASATISTPITAFTVVNQLDCVKVGILVVGKKVENNTTGDLSNWTYPVIVTCGTSTTYNLPDGGSQTVNNLPFGTLCYANENALPVPANACLDKGTAPVWSTSITPSVTIGNAPSAITVLNKLDCRPGDGQVGILIVEKQVKNMTQGNVTGWTYPVNVTCGTAPTLNLADYQPQTVNNLPFGTSCSVTENTPPVPANACSDMTMPVWQTTIVPPNATIGASPVTIVVQNTLVCQNHPIIACPPGTMLRGKECVRPTICPPPLVPGPIAGQCLCALGTVLRGRECVRQIVCRPPQIPTAAGTCGCPAGLVARGRTCVPQVVCNPPAKLNRRGVCECPPNMVARGKTCIAREARPAITPGDVIRNIPRGGRDFPGGGRGNPGVSPRGNQSAPASPGRR